MTWRITLIDDDYRIEKIDSLGEVRCTLLVPQTHESDAMHLVTTLSLSKAEPLMCGVGEVCQNCGR
jgi:hypothetical protein